MFNSVRAARRPPIAGTPYADAAPRENRIDITTITY